MGWSKWLLMAGAVAAGYYGYCRIKELEREIRRELAAEEEAGPPEPERSPPGEQAQGLEERILERVRERPGVLQTEVYDLFPGEGRRALQELLRQMEGEGTLQREREGSTYRLRARRG